MKSDSIGVVAGEHAFRVHVTDPELRDEIRGALVGNTRPADDLLLGYKIDSPARSGGMFVILSGAGDVLGRVRNRHDVVQILLNHLATRLTGPPAHGRLRIGLRMLTTTTRTALIGPDLATKPVLIERQMERSGVSLLDSPFVDVDPASAEISALATPPGSRVGSSFGVHISPTAFEGTLSELIWFGDHLPSDPSRSLVTRELARFARNGNREFRLRESRRLASNLSVRILGSRDSRRLVEELASD